jgi:hypothetical protein
VLPSRDDAHRFIGDRLFAVVGLHGATLGLRDDLRGDDDDIAVFEVGRVDDEGGEVVASRDLGQPLDAFDAELHGNPRLSASEPILAASRTPLPEFGHGAPDGARHGTGQRAGGNAWSRHPLLRSGR